MALHKLHVKFDKLKIMEYLKHLGKPTGDVEACRQTGDVEGSEPTGDIEAFGPTGDVEAWRRLPFHPDEDSAV